jgi:hypothetical protein
MFFHKLYGWVNRRYKFDGFNNTLYHKGQVLLGEEEALEIVANKQPYINTTVTDTPKRLRWLSALMAAFNHSTEHLG